MANAPYPQIYYSLISCLRLLPVAGKDIIIPNMLWCQAVFWGWGACPETGSTEWVDFVEVGGRKKFWGRWLGEEGKESLVERDGKVEECVREIQSRYSDSLTSPTL